MPQPLFIFLLSTEKEQRCILNDDSFKEYINPVNTSTLLWNKHEYQHSADIFVKNIFNPFPGTGLFLYFLKYIRKPEVS